MAARFLLIALLAGACRAPASKTTPLENARSWAIQLQGFHEPGAIDALERAPVDLVVIDATRTVRGFESFPTKEVVARLRARKICLAYLNVGQAEDYRTYWRPYWRPPTADGPGRPPYLLALDPDGWEGNYPVAYWDLRWRGVLWGTPSAPLDQAIADGFDGVYLDWVLGFEDAAVIAAARAAGVDPARAMAELIRDLRRYGRRRKPGFFVVAQNCAELPRRVPEFLDWIDGVAQEDLSYAGRAGAAWEDAAAGGIATPEELRARLVAGLRGIRARGLPVFTLDYALDPGQAAEARRRSRELGFVPFISRTPLDRLP